jgi:hypothetical protein
MEQLSIIDVAIISSPGSKNTTNLVSFSDLTPLNQPNIM